MPAEYLRHLPEPVDLAIYSLSLHHIPPEHMEQSLKRTANFLTSGSKMIVIEPGMKGSFIELEEKYSVGCGNEREQKNTAKSTLFSTNTLQVKNSIDFYTQIYFENVQDFYKYMLPRNWKGDNTSLEKDLIKHSTGQGIQLYAERTAYLLEPK